MFQTASSIIKSLALVILLQSCSAKTEVRNLPYYNTADFTPNFINDRSEANSKIDHTIPVFSFTDQHNNLITDQDVRGKIHIANFIFTKCGSICPIMTGHLKLLQQEFANDSNLVMLSYSVTPWMDSVAELNKFALASGITSPNWHLLTGDKNSIYTLARQSYFAEEDLGFTKDSSEFLHTEHVLLVDRNMRLRGIYNGTLELDIRQLAEDIKTLRSE